MLDGHADDPLLLPEPDLERLGVDPLDMQEPDPARPLEGLCSAEVAVEPFGLAMTPDDKTILVTSAYGQKMTALDSGSMVAKYDVKLPREPRAILVDDSGERAFVAHVVGAKMSVVDLKTDKHEAREVDLRVKRVVSTASVVIHIPAPP